MSDVGNDEANKEAQSSNSLITNDHDDECSDDKKLEEEFGNVESCLYRWPKLIDYECKYCVADEMGTNINWYEEAKSVWFHQNFILEND